MTGKRVLGIIGLDAAGCLVARRALDSGAALVLHGPSAGTGDTRTAFDGADIRLAEDLEAFAAALEPPRAMLIGLSADGGERDPRRNEFLRSALAHLKPGDLLMTCSGDSWPEHEIMASRCAEGGFGFVDFGALASTGRRGSSVLTAGGTKAAWALAQGFVGEDSAAALVGGSGAGATSTLVHAAMDGLVVELIAEIYHVLKSEIRVSYDEMRTIFSKWNSEELADPLVAATADALGLRDEDGEPLLEKVLDAAAAVGPCARAASIALEAGVPAPMTSQAAAAAAIASLKDARMDASAILGGPKTAMTGERPFMIEEIRKAFLASTILASAEGFALLGAASALRGLDLDLCLAARLWAEADGSRIYGRASEALARLGGRKAIILDAPVKLQLDQSMPSLRRVAARALESGIPVPALSAALAFYDCYRSTWLPANLANALKDSMQGSGFERIDRPRGELFHSEWR